MQYALCIGRIHIHTRLRVSLVSEFSAGILLLTSSIYCLLRFHQAGIIVVKHLIQGRNNEVWVAVEPSTLWSWPS